MIMDEPTTAVDILTQRSILDVLKELRRELNFSVIFISHDLAVAAEIADTIATMYAGEFVEIGPVEEVFYHPRHAYTLSLLNAAPRLSAGAEELHSIPGSPPDLIDPPPGCKFHPRCRFANEVCTHVPPEFIVFNQNHGVACHPPGGKHKPHGPRRLELRHNLQHRLHDLRTVIRQGLPHLLIAVVTNHPVPGTHQPPCNITAHLAKPNDCDIHLSLLLVANCSFRCRAAHAAHITPAL